MEASTQQPKGRDGAISSLNAAIEAMNLAKEISSVTPAKAVFGSVSILLTMIKVCFLFCDGSRSRLTPGQDSIINKLDYVELGLNCAEICKALDRGMSGRKLDELNQSVCDAINQLSM